MPRRLGAQGRRAAAHVVALLFDEAQVDDDPDARDGERRLGHIRREDDFASTGRGGRKDTRLVRGGQRGVQRKNEHGRHAATAASAAVAAAAASAFGVGGEIASTKIGNELA